MVRTLLRRGLLRRLFLLALVVVGLYALYWSQEVMGKQCTREGSLELLGNLCALYASSKVDGSLCQELCIFKSFTYRTCFNRVGGKEVIQLGWDNRQAVLKTRHARLSQYDPVYKGVLDDDVQPRVMSWKTFGDIVNNHVQATFGIQVDLEDEELLRRLSMQPIDTSDDEQNGIQMNSLWALLQQEEYLFLMYFGGTAFLPKIYGTCGHFYFEEFVPSGAVFQTKSQSISERFVSASWERRAQVAKGLLDIVKATDVDFKEALHLCDVKPENFGIVEDKVKAVDIDISFFDRVMGNMLEQPDCSTHRDCDFFDCHGVCDLQAKKCTRQRKNNNFQAICGDIFQRKPGNSGLLRRPPARIEDQLSELLERCIYPEAAENMAKGSTTETFRKMYALLTSSCKC